VLVQLVTELDGILACCRFRSQLLSTFYSVSALLVMQTAVIARPFLSVCLSVCHSVTFRCFLQMNEDTIMRFEFYLSLVSGEVKFMRIFAGNHSQRRR